ncbi:protein of unknown function (plasmid) [Cupriavidus taiwanensis]|uniref:Uncharacterized protein n=1 Tax=Cupriavidus taiwanensis TaxID=164546 RepID=A0A7Z7JFH9_9BURK|nr:protein of unknown function [Cupriavidus taiwanensis]SOZ11604.1 protein of unknown function [Cupriavidus taiwanensis]SOZ42959.1 protein of unknown function [Cupriavidus taiwanensis]SPC22206.1 protein of unknown function [Cupriavidus taiwanensis]SPD53708.1 protein of unknown function [Cupriavidus taiwanensis]
MEWESGLFNDQRDGGIIRAGATFRFPLHAPDFPLCDKPRATPQVQCAGPRHCRAGASTPISQGTGHHPCATPAGNSSSVRCLKACRVRST